MNPYLRYLMGIRYMWPMVAILLAVIWKGPQIARVAGRVGLILTPIGALVGAILWGGNAGGPASGAMGLFVFNGFTIWCAIGALKAAARITNSRLGLSLALVAGGVAGMFVGVIAALWTVCLVTHDCL